MAAVLAANPFADEPPNRVMAIFLAGAPPANTLDHVSGRTDEPLSWESARFTCITPAGWLIRG